MEKENEVQSAAKPKKSLTKKQLLIACGVAFAFILMMNAIAGEESSPAQTPAPAPTPAAATPPPSTADQAAGVDFAKLAGQVQSLQKTGFIKKMDVSLNAVYVDPYSWAVANIDEKQAVSRALAFYVGHEKGTNAYWVEIFDYQSGEKLAKYSETFGFKTY